MRSSNPPVTNRRPPKGYFTEAEAAESLCLTLPQFRTLVRHHILESEDDLANLSITSYQPADLALLRLFAFSAPIDSTATLR